MNKHPFGVVARTRTVNERLFSVALRSRKANERWFSAHERGLGLAALAPLGQRFQQAFFFLLEREIDVRFQCVDF